MLFLLRNSLCLFLRPEVFCLFISLDFKGPLRSYSLPSTALSPQCREPTSCLVKPSPSPSHQRAGLLSPGILHIFPSTSSAGFSWIPVLCWHGLAEGLPCVPSLGSPCCSLPPSCCPSIWTSSKPKVWRGDLLWSLYVSGPKQTLWRQRPCTNNPEHTVVA